MSLQRTFRFIPNYISPRALGFLSEPSPSLFLEVKTRDYIKPGVDVPTYQSPRQHAINFREKKHWNSRP